MIAITSPEQFTNAAKRARELKPRVWSNVFGTYFVEGQSQDYKVVFSKVNGQFFGECNCKAHQNNRICYHLASSLQVHKIQIGIKQQVRAAEAALVPSVADWTINEKEAA